MRPLVAEFVGTALFVFLGVSSIVVNAVSNNGVGVVGISLAHGVGMAIIVTMTMSISGAAMNPARAFGPALISGNWHGHAAYWLGPLVGATAAGALWKFILLPKDAADIG